jgi:hypothetical protein
MILITIVLSLVGLASALATPVRAQGTTVNACVNGVNGPTRTWDSSKFTHPFPTGAKRS